MATHAQGRTAADAAPRPLHNAALLTAASLAAKGCGFVLLLVAARVLGKDGFGEYSQVMAFVGLFAVATDLGLSTLAVRDVAQERALLPRYVGNVLALRLLLGLLAAVACITLAVALRYNTAVCAGIVLWASPQCSGAAGSSRWSGWLLPPIPPRRWRRSGWPRAWCGSVSAWS